MARLVETAKGSYKLLKGESGTLAVSTIDKLDVYEFDKPVDELTDDEVISRVEQSLIDEEFDAEFLNDDFSWVHDFQQW